MRVIPIPPRPHHRWLGPPALVLASAALLAASVACGQDAPAAAAVETLVPGTLTVAVTNRSVPDPLDPEYWMERYVERFGQDLGLPIDWKVVPFDKSWELAGRDVVDLVATNVASFPDRVSAGGTFSTPFLYERRALRIRASDASRYATIADFVGKRIGAVQGMAAERDLLKRAPPGVHVVSTMTFPELYEQFRDGRLDAVAQAEYYALDGRVIPSYGPDIALIDHHDLYPGQREESVFIVRDKSRGLLDAVNRFVATTRFPVEPPETTRP
jgi:ABC-type amino acid transport substrate-binding protein